MLKNEVHFVTIVHVSITDHGHIEILHFKPELVRAAVTTLCSSTALLYLCTSHVVAVFFILGVAADSTLPVNRLKGH